MNAFNPIAFVTRDEIPLVIKGRKVTGYAVDLDELSKLANQFEWFGRRMRGENFDPKEIPESELLEFSTLLLAASLAPDTRGEERREVEKSARAIRADERIALLNLIMADSFEKLGLESGEGNAKKPVNRRQRRAARSKDGGSKPQT